MIDALRDWLRTRNSLSSLDIAIRGDSTGDGLPRCRLFVVSDPRELDLDGQAQYRQRRFQIDVYAQKGQVAWGLAKTIETELESLPGTITGGWNFDDVNIEDVADGPPEPSVSGKDEPINHVFVDVMVSGTPV